jgi:hypothetical protein
MAAVELRTHIFLDSMQPQFAAYVASTAKGYLPVAGQAALYVEVAPGIFVNRITDVALKKTDVRPGIQVVERAYGLLEIHAHSQAEVLEAGRQILAHLELREEDRLKPAVVSTQIITNVDDHQAMLINRSRSGQMLLGGQTLFILECHPAGYVTIAANEAEKASPISLVDMRAFGAFGRLYLGGTEAHIQEASRAALKAIEGVSGKKNPEAERHL